MQRKRHSQGLIRQNIGFLQWTIFHSTVQSISTANRISTVYLHQFVFFWPLPPSSAPLSDKPSFIIENAALPTHLRRDDISMLPSEPTLMSKASGKVLCATHFSHITIHSPICNLQNKTITTLQINSDLLLVRKFTNDEHTQLLTHNMVYIYVRALPSFTSAHIIGGWSKNAYHISDSI